ncbi:MAG: hypothetical protein M1827_006243 [Pycnora praestabilis]|nr:MAG: hypothetical protein M1827_006243 [Pycnora praestabilis]
MAHSGGPEEGRCNIVINKPAPEPDLVQWSWLDLHNTAEELAVRCPGTRNAGGQISDGPDDALSITMYASNTPFDLAYKTANKARLGHDLTTTDLDNWVKKFITMIGKPPQAGETAQADVQSEICVATMAYTCKEDRDCVCPGQECISKAITASNILNVLFGTAKVLVGGGIGLCALSKDL